jgi:NADH:ubiquinone oxidoreductase subunit 5 (subunit L)/multisubunit Na+/H+ antiporter MnhA subunit
VVAVAISWQTGTGTSPDATSPITVTISDVSIEIGDTIYALTADGMVAVGTATVSGEATVTFTTESVFIVSAFAKSAQFPLQVNSATAPVSHSVKLSTIGGSGGGAITYNVTGER